MKKVLIISYRYPPQSGSGITRALKFTRYLPSFGWKPYVISLHKKINNSKSEDIPKNTSVYYTTNIILLDDFFSSMAKKSNNYMNKPDTKKTISWIIKSLKTSITYLLPDVHVGWIPLTLIAGIQIIRRENIDVIYATSPPATSAIIGALLKKITKTPLIIDFRDAWTYNPNLSHVTKFNKTLESFVLKNADKFIVVTPVIQKQYLSEYPYLIKKTNLIYNGFDFNDLPSKMDINPFEKFTIAYTGTFGGTRSPHLFIKSIEHIIQTNKIPKDKFQIKFVGLNDISVKEISSNILIKDVIEFVPKVPSKEVMRLIYNSHLLLLIEFKDAFTTKVFEYLTSGRPILALISTGELEKFIIDYSSNSCIITSGDIEEISNSVVGFYNQWENDKDNYCADYGNVKFMDNFNREKLTKELVYVLNEIS